MPVNYSSVAMDSLAALLLIGGFLLFVLFAVSPSVAGLVGYLTWKGKPTNFDSGMYFAAFIATGGVSTFLIACAVRMHADVGTWQYLLQLACFLVGALIFGIAMGCGVGVFTYRRSRPPTPPDTPS
jgi:hypothetical protein